MTLPCGRPVNEENQPGPAHGVRVDQDGILSAQSWLGKGIIEERE